VLDRREVYDKGEERETEKRGWVSKEFRTKYIGVGIIHKCEERRKENAYIKLTGSLFVVFFSAPTPLGNGDQGLRTRRFNL